MNLCSWNHEEICFDGKDCPLCDCMKDNDMLSNQVCDLEKEVIPFIQRSTT